MYAKDFLHAKDEASSIPTKTHLGLIRITRLNASSLMYCIPYVHTYRCTVQVYTVMTGEEEKLPFSLSLLCLSLLGTHPNTVRS